MGTVLKGGIRKRGSSNGETVAVEHASRPCNPSAFIHQERGAFLNFTRTSKDTLREITPLPNAVWIDTWGHATGVTGVLGILPLSAGQPGAHDGHALHSIKKTVTLHFDFVWSDILIFSMPSTPKVNS